MGEMWKADPRPLPAEGPAWPGDDERVTYKGLTVQPHADLEMWEARDDSWEIGLAITGETMLVLRTGRERALAIAERLADAKDWTALPQAPTWCDIAFDPLVLRLIADYPGMVSLTIPEDDDSIIPYGDDDSPNDFEP